MVSPFKHSEEWTPIPWQDCTNHLLHMVLPNADIAPQELFFRALHFWKEIQRRTLLISTRPSTCISADVRAIQRSRWQYGRFKKTFSIQVLDLFPQVRHSRALVKASVWLIFATLTHCMLSLFSARRSVLWSPLTLP